MKKVRLCLLLLFALLTALPCFAAPTRPAPGLLLVADESMRDSRFEKSVVLILSHHAGGTRGLILNKPTDWSVSHAFPKLKESLAPFDRIFYGGPVAPYQPVALIQTDSPPAEGLPVLGGIYLVELRVALERLMGGEDPQDRMRFYLGYAGWAPGQLQKELGRGSWRLVEPDGLDLLEEHEELWKRLQAPLTLQASLQPSGR